MDAHLPARWIAVIVGAVFCTNGFGSTVRTYSGDFDLRIPAEPTATKGWMEDAVLDVRDHLIIEDLDVVISITHTKAFDLQVSLSSPAGTTVLLNMYDPFTEYFEGEDYSGTIFDDEATVPIEAGKAPFSGSFKPKSPGTLSIFDGQDAYGPWHLQVYDAFYADSGRFSSFGLTMTVPEPASAAFLSLGIAVLLTLRRAARP